MSPSSPEQLKCETCNANLADVKHSELASNRQRITHVRPEINRGTCSLVNMILSIKSHMRRSGGSESVAYETRALYKSLQGCRASRGQEGGPRAPAAPMVRNKDLKGDMDDVAILVRQQEDTRRP